MAERPADDPLRAELRGLPVQERKLVGGLVTLMIGHPDRARDREWVAESFLALAVAVHGFDDSTAVDRDVDTVRTFAEARAGELIELAARLFVRTAEDLQAAGGRFGYDEACAHAASYLGG